MKSLLILLWQISALGATYHVDYSGGADTQTGLSSSEAFLHCPGDPRATDNANITLSAGDAVVFRGGITYAFDSGTTDYIAANNSGSVGSPITYRSGHLISPQWGTTPALIDGSNANVSLGVLSLGAYSYITVDGLTIYNQPTINNYMGMIGWEGSSGGNIIIQNCTLNNGGGDGVYIKGTWGAGTNPGNFTITNCVMHDFNAHCIFLRAGLDNVTITNCTLYRPGVQAYAGTAAGDCVFCGHGTTDLQSNIVIAGSDMSEAPIKGHVILAAYMNTVKMYGNRFHGTNGAFSIAHSCSVTNEWIYNNVFDCSISTYEGVIRYYTDEGTASAPVYRGLRVWNNTFHCNPDIGAIVYIFKGNSTVDTMLYDTEIKNNIIWNTNSSSKLVSIGANAGNSGPLVDPATFTCDYNCYYGGESSQFFWSTDGDRTFAQWKSSTGQDSHSVAADPLTLSDSNFVLQPTSPCRGAGVDLAAYFTTDYAGWRRTVPWDLGAYESQAVMASKTIRIGTIRGK